MPRKKATKNKPTQEIDENEMNDDLDMADDIDDIPIDEEIEADEEADESEENDGDDLEDIVQDDQLDDIESIISNMIISNAEIAQDPNFYITKPENMITRNILSIYNLTEIIGQRTKEIDNSNNMDRIIFTDLPDNITNSRNIAIKELLEKKCPYDLLLYIGTTADGKKHYEKYHVNDMIIPIEKVVQ